MKYLKLFESLQSKGNKLLFDESKIHEICNRYNITNYTINKDGSIDVYNVDLYEKGLTKLPLKFNKVNGNFNCDQNNLTSLEGSPIEVNGYFDCYDNKLTSFEYAPKIIRGCFWCKQNYIKTFEYFPSFVKGSFDCSDNPIYQVWVLFKDYKKIELLNDCDIFRDEDKDTPTIIMDRLNDFLLTIGIDTVEKVKGYKNI